ncbi:MAG TPA: CbiX/SirB N-terminal domain-containing protein [Gemmatimonadaceae bacterium]|jgi:sirohydrochlorin ferrochelatase|nr:CbiX/SirB N-terminal domain-containing protein [Gemmatimonadaceae bacterium]
MRAILIIDHGSVRLEANHMLSCVANLLQSMVGAGVLVRYAHMELAEPSIEQSFAACVEAGASEVIAFPYMLSPGKHSTRDIPRLVGEAAARFPGVVHRVTPAFGVNRQLAEVIAERAGVEVVAVAAPESACRCWDTEGRVGACGPACAATIAEVPISS